jgi:hypothetical protein
MKHINETINYLFICGLFKDAVCGLDDTVLNDRMISE